MTEATKTRASEARLNIFQHVNIFSIGVIVKRRFGLIGFALLLMGSGILVLNYQQQILSLMNQYKLLPQPERFTELYLNEHLNLPTIVAEDQIASASFTIHNKEHRKVTYPFVVKQQVDDFHEIIGSGEAELRQDEQITIPFKFALASPEAKTKIEIALLNTNQTVHFWVNNIY
ncbi:MAG: hypothetical protein ACOCXQ_00480 [Patescibacteria group bacterium]